MIEMATKLASQLKQPRLPDQGRRVKGLNTAAEPVLEPIVQARSNGLEESLDEHCEGGEL